MIDRDKVIKGLEICRHRVISQENCMECPYIYDGRSKQSNCEGVLHWDALALIKEQEAVEPKQERSGSGVTWWNICGACKTAINPNDKFCHECGRAVKWD